MTKVWKIWQFVSKFENMPKYAIWPLHFRGHKDMNLAHLIVGIRSELRKQNMTFHKLPGSSDSNTSGSGQGHLVE